METRNCQNCKKDFVIESEDFLYYKKIGVPAPTFCRECRIQRRFAYRNERTLHRRKCSATGKDIISCFAPDAPFTVVDRDYWWTDEWSPLDYGKAYDFSQPFFLQFHELMKNVPMPALFLSKNIMTKYGNHLGEFKNAYLVSASWKGENIMYSSRAINCRDSMDLFSMTDSEYTYDSVHCQKCNKVFYSEQSASCVNSYFLYDCRNCSDCFGCTNLRNKSYCIFNEQYSTTDYNKKLDKIFGGSYVSFNKAKDLFDKLKIQAIHRYATMVNCVNVTGDNLSNVSNSKYCFDTVGDFRDSKYIINSPGPAQDCYDGYGIGANSSLQYEATDAGVNGSKQYFVVSVWDSTNIEYSYNCHGCNNLFGCVGLRKKDYCIFNKEYSKDEYHEIVAKIKEHMKTQPYVDKKGRTYSYGEYFPIELSPFGYNETVAQDYFPLTREDIEKEGYIYREPEKSQHTITKKAAELDDSVLDIDESILKVIIECEDCKRAYRIMPDELTFLKRFTLPLPRKCFECRHQERLTRTNFPRLYKRKCMCALNGHSHLTNCDNEFETTYSPEKPEMVYCESCYQKEVV